MKNSSISMPLNPARRIDGKITVRSLRSGSNNAARATGWARTAGFRQHTKNPRHFDSTPLTISPPAVTLGMMAVSPGTSGLQAQVFDNGYR